MAGFLYFLPGWGDSISPQQIKEVGLGHAFDNPGRKAPRPIRAASPSGTPGLMVADHARIDDSLVRYLPEQQTWRPHPGGKYWIGYYTEQRPVPDDLVRPDPLPGVRLTLADGHEWLVPIARRWSASDDPQIYAQYAIALPRVLDFTSSGAIVLGDVLPRYGQLWELSQAFVNVTQNVATEAEQALLDGDAGIHAAGLILSANYALDSAEAMILRLFTQHNWMDVHRAFNEWEEALHLREKKILARLASPPSSNGREGSSPTTDPPPPT